MTATSAATRIDANNLIQRFHEDCNLRGMVSTMDYIYRSKRYCAFLETREKNPLNADRDDLRAFLAQLKARSSPYFVLSRLGTTTFIMSSSIVHT